MLRWSKKDDVPRNLILFGPAGTGKSHLINYDISDLLGLTEQNTFRITFHPEYSHFEFFGQFKPCVAYEVGMSKIVYPGQKRGPAPQFIELHMSEKFIEEDDKRLNLRKECIPIVYNITEQAEIRKESDDLIGQSKMSNVEASETKIHIVDGADKYDVEVYIQRPSNPLLRVRTKSDKAFVEFLTKEYHQQQGEDRVLKLEKIGEKQFRVVRGHTSIIDEEESNRKPLVYYSFVPGPFLKALVHASKNPTENCALVIEEINRGNCAAIFGDVFQLLDRAENGESKYPVTPNPEALAFLKSQGLDRKSLCIPENLSILATMNIADQSLTSLDIAFKRRWHMLYVGLEDSSSPEIQLPKPLHETKWSDLLSALNFQISTTVSEDHVIGPYFFTRDVSPEDFASKLLAHLWFDVVRHERSLIFDAEITSFEKLIENVHNDQNIFCKTILEKIQRNHDAA